MKPWPSPNAKNRDCWTSDNFLNGERLAKQTARWIEKNQQDFFTIYNIVKDLQAHGFKGRLRDRVTVEGMKRGAQFADDGYKFANGLWAGIARYLVILDPSLEDNPVEMGKSDIDVYGLEPVTLEYKEQK